jgi:hypothetical protein
LQSEGEVVANDTGPITNEISIEQVEENIPHSPSKEEASSFVASKEEISPAAKKEDNHNIAIDDSQSGESEWPTSWIPYPCHTPVIILMSVIIIVPFHINYNFYQNNLLTMSSLSVAFLSEQQL